jgi:hypothetical protein
MTDLKAVPTSETMAPPPATQPTRTRRGALLPYLAALLVTTYVCWPMASGRYFGDVGDARWTVSLHEHWYRVWQGREAINSLLSYDPLTGTLGTSDAFFVQGQIYSVARLLGAGLPQAWAMTQVAFFVIGALGVATLSGYLVKYVATRCAFVVLVCASYPVIFSIGHVQLIGFLSTSWIVVGWFELSRRRHVLLGWILVCLVPPLIALSSWYAIVLFVAVAAFVSAFQLLFSSGREITRGGRILFAQLWSLLVRPPAVVTAVLGLALWVSVAWIYLPAKRLLPPPQWNDTLTFAPRWSEVLNASGQGGGIWGQLYARLVHSPVGFEQARGFTPVLFICFMVLGIAHLRRTVLADRGGDSVGSWPGSRRLAAVWLAVLAAVASVIVDERGLGVYYFVFNHVPGMDSIRSPFRIQAFTYALAILVVLRSVELLVDEVPRPGHSGVVLRRIAVAVGVGMVLVILVEMQRPIPANWSPQQFLDPALLQQVSTAQRVCDAIVVDNATDPLLNVIDGVDFAAVSGLPTPQGYGRADPLGHPGLAATPSQLATWMRSHGFAGRICQVSPAAVQPVPTS